MIAKIRFLSYLFLIVFLIISSMGIYRAVCDKSMHGSIVDLKKIQKHNLEDRNGNILGTTIYLYDFYINLAHVAFEERLVKQLKNAIPNIENTNIITNLHNKISQNKSGWVLIAKNLTKQEKDNIRMQNIDGAKFDEVYARYYPYGSLFSHIVGRTNLDYEAQSGLERFF